MKKSIFLVFAIFTGIIYSQKNDPGYNGLNVTFMRSDIKKEANGPINNRFYSENWIKGILDIEKKGEVLQDKINYDLVTGELHITKQKNGFIILDKNILRFVLKSETENVHFIRKDKNNFVDKSIERDYFLNPFPASNNQFVIIDFRRVLNESKNQNDGFTDVNNLKKYKNRSHYYILNSNDKYEKIKLNKKNVLKVLSDKEKELTIFIKANKLKVKKIEDLQRILHYYHSL